MCQEYIRPHDRSHHVHLSADVPTALSFVRETGLDLGVFFYVWVFVILASSSNAVNLTDGLDGLASGSSILVLSAFVFIAFWQFRHTCDLLAGANGCYPVDGPHLQDAAIVAAAVPDPARKGQPSPPTAQHASRLGKVVGRTVTPGVPSAEMRRSTSSLRWRGRCRRRAGRQAGCRPA